MTSTPTRAVSIASSRARSWRASSPTTSTAASAGPILVMLTTDYYSHDHQQLLMPQGTRLIGTVQSVGNAQQRKMFVTFHRAICPDGFSLDFDKYIGLDPLGTTGLATKVDHGYLQAFAAAAAIGGLGGLAQIGNNGSVLSSFHANPQRHLGAIRRRGRAGPESLPQPPAHHHAQGRFARPRVHRHGHPDPVLRGTSRRSNPVAVIQEHR